MQKPVRSYALAQQITKPRGYWSSAASGHFGHDFCRRIAQMRSGAVCPPVGVNGAGPAVTAPPAPGPRVDIASISPERFIPCDTPSLIVSIRTQMEPSVTNTIVPISAYLPALLKTKNKAVAVISHAAISDFTGVPSQLFSDGTALHSA